MQQSKYLTFNIVFVKKIILSLKIFNKIFIINISYYRIVIFQMKARLMSILRYLNLHGAQARITMMQNIVWKRGKKACLRNAYFILSSVLHRYIAVGNSRDSKYSATAKIASSHGNCNRVLIAWIFILVDSVACICLRKTRALLGSSYNVTSRCGVATDDGFSHGEQIYRQKLISRNRLKYSLKRLVRCFPARAQERREIQPTHDIVSGSIQSLC